MYIYRGDGVYLIISNSNDMPIYEQITEQIKDKIISGELDNGDILPSIRGLAKDLKISVITTKRAYEELERMGYIKTITGKGSYVNAKNKELLKEEMLKRIESNILNIISIANKTNIDKKEIMDLFNYLYEEEKHEQ